MNSWSNLPNKLPLTFSVAFCFPKSQRIDSQRIDSQRIDKVDRQV